MKTPQELRPLYYHLLTERAVAARPRLYKKMLKHWNSESGYISMSYDCYEKLIIVTRDLYSLLGKRATDTIIAMSAALPPYFKPLQFVVFNVPHVRPQLGIKLECNNITTINSNQYAILKRLPDAVRSRENYWEMRKFEYENLFWRVTQDQREKH